MRVLPRGCSHRERDRTGLEFDMANPTCFVDDCGKRVIARGMCSRHYGQWRKANPDKVRAYNVRAGAGNKQCPMCDVWFRPKKSMLQLYCSDKCYYAAKSPDSTTSMCDAVGCVRPVRARGMCSMHYRRWRRAEGLENVEPWSEERYQRWKKRQDQKRATQVQPIRNLDVFERDKWVCGICGDPVDQSLEWPDPLCATLDHILPLSKGGHHVWENVRLAHARCNSGRGDQVSV